MKQYYKFTCKSCGSHGAKVTETRAQETYNRRRRECLACGHRTTSYEISEEQMLIYEAALSFHLRQQSFSDKLRLIADQMDNSRCR
jgi:transcriptional regulator NrdR family protein